MNKPPKLKPCPFDGCKVVIVEAATWDSPMGGETKGWWVHCARCRVGYKGDRKQDTIDDWNRRVGTGDK